MKSSYDDKRTHASSDEESDFDEFPKTFINMEEIKKFIEAAMLKVKGRGLDANPKEVTKQTNKAVWK